eukprot:scaffold486_cov148-Skeletonema_dohrnii-CCMP3373.AAC.4
MDEDDALPEPLKPHIGKLLIENKMDNPFMKEMEMIQQQLADMGTAKDDVLPLPNSGGEDEDTSTTPQAPTDGGAMMEQIEDGDYDDNNDISRPHLSNHNNHRVSVLEDHPNTLSTSSKSKSSTVSFRLEEDPVHDDNNNTSTDVEEDDPLILPEHKKNGRRGLVDNRPRRRRRKNHRVSVLDHYTLSTSSSTVRFRSAHVHVYDFKGSQLIMEERLPIQGERSSLSLMHLGVGNGEQSNISTKVTVKQVVNSSPGLHFLRGLYSVIAFFNGAFMFIIAVALLLFLISDLANQARIIVYGTGGATRDIVFPFVGTILSIPVFLHGLTQLMTLVTSFVADVFAGSPLLLSLFGGGLVLTNWIKFIFYVGIPTLTFVGLLFSGSQDFHSITLVSSCLYLVEELYAREGMTTMERLKLTILNAEESCLSGKVHRNYIYDSNVYDLKRLDSTSMAARSTRSTRRLQAELQEGGNDKAMYLYSTHGQWYIKFTQLLPRGLFTTLELPMRCWTQEEIDFSTPIYTKRSWSLESVFCRIKNESHISVVSGQSAVTPKQSFSSLVCYFFGVMFNILLVTGLMVFAQFRSTTIAAVACVLIVYWFWQGRKEYMMLKRINKIHQRLQSEDEDYEDYDSALFQKWETFSITKPTLAFAWISFIVKIIIFAVIPFSYFCYSRNVFGAMTYLVLSLLYIVRHYFDIGPIVEALGSYGTLGMEPGTSLAHSGLLGASTRREFQKKSRLYHITRMNNNASRRIWT